MNQLLASLAPHPSKRISELAATMPGVVDLTVGAPPFGPPQAFRRKLAELVGHDGDEATETDCYAHSRGLPELRRGIGDLYAREYGHTVDPEHEVLVTNGAVGALVAAVVAATDPGDEVLLVDPSYMIYAPMIQLLDRVVRRVPTAADSDFLVDLGDLGGHITARTRVLLVNSPANPTGAMCDAKRMTRLCELAREAGLRLIHDEVLDCFAGQPAHVPAIVVDTGGVAVCVNSLSKRFGMTGWRLGWLVADREFVAAATKGHTFFTLAVGHAVQKAAAAALADDRTQAELRRHVQEIRNRGAEFLRLLRQVPGLTVGTDPPGGFYAFVDIRGYADHRGVTSTGGESTSEAVARHMLEATGVAVVPGNAFGASGEGFVRMSFARPASVLSTAAERLSARVPNKWSE